MRIVKCVSINRQTTRTVAIQLKGHGQERLYSHGHLLTRVYVVNRTFLSSLSIDFLYEVDCLCANGQRRWLCAFPRFAFRGLTGTRGGVRIGVILIQG